MVVEDLEEEPRMSLSFQRSRPSMLIHLHWIEKMVKFWH